MIYAEWLIVNLTASLDQVRVFHDLSKQETFLVVVL